ncbi:MAG: hypothetical protein R2800_03290 [Flavipsychrobacter sp.]
MFWLLCVAITNNSFGQDTVLTNRSFDKGTQLLSLSYGVITQASGIAKSIGQKKDYSIFGPLKWSYEIGVSEDIGVAPKLNYAHVIDKTFDPQLYYGAVHIGVFGYYHFGRLINAPKVDLFAGVGGYMGVVFTDNGGSGSTDYASNAFPALSCGARYYLTHSFAFFAEVGAMRQSFVDLGFTIKVK